MQIPVYDAIYLQSVVQIHPTPRIPLFVGPSVTEKDRIVLANEYTMRTSSPMYDAVKMMMMLIIYVRCDHHHDDYHQHLCTMRSSSL